MLTAARQVKMKWYGTPPRLAKGVQSMSKSKSCGDFSDMMPEEQKVRAFSFHGCNPSPNTTPLNLSEVCDTLPRLAKGVQSMSKSKSCGDFSDMMPEEQKVRAFNSHGSLNQLESTPCKIVAHRGGSCIAPENTAGAIEVGLKYGAKGVEFDLQSTRDGHLVVLHDNTLERTAVPYAQACECPSCPFDEAEYDQILRTDINNLDLDTVQKVDVSGVLPSWPHSESIITFEKAIRQVQRVEGAFCFAEIKKGDTQSADRAATIIAKTKASPDQVTFISFSLPTISRVKKLLPNFTCLHVMDLLPSMKESVIQDQIKTSLDSCIDGIDLCAYPEVVTKELCQYVNSRGKRLDVWVSSKVPGMDSVKNMLLMAQNGVEHFTSDIPADIIEYMSMVKNS